MRSKNNKLIFLLLLISFLKGVIWAAIVPIWHTPDEQAHFAEISFIAEKKRLPLQIINPGKEEKDLSKEILISEQLLGTERDQAGINKFTYHPEYNLPYEDSLIGKYENQIKNLPKTFRIEMVKNEAATYPPLYYFLGAGIYLIFSQSDLFIRVFMIRILSILIIVLSVYFSFKIAQEIFQNFLLQLTIPVLVSFQPMFTFVGSGVNSDNLANLLFTISGYLWLKVLRNGIERKTSIFLGIISGLGILTKPQFLISLPITFCFFLFKIRKRQWQKLAKNFIFYILCFIFFGGWWVIRLLIITESPLPSNWAPLPSLNFSISLFDFIKAAAIKLIRETLPWYWGVFKWLGVVLPRFVNKNLMRVVILACFGFLIWFLKVLKKRKFGLFEKQILFLAIINFFYIGSLYLADFFYIKRHGFSIGMQGRYFLPMISCQMILMIVGLLAFLSENWRILRKIVIIFSCFGMIILNFVALGTVFKAYYPAPDLKTAIFWVSQYKPWFFKGIWLIIFFSFYLLNLGWFLKNYVKDSFRQSTDKPF